MWTVSLHSPTHWAVGRAIGIDFTDYFIGGPPPPRPGLKSDYATYLRADPDSRAWMHASGAIMTKVAPLFALAFWPRIGRAVVERGGVGGDLRRVDRDGRRVLGQGERLEEVPPGAGRRQGARRRLSRPSRPILRAEPPGSSGTPG